VLLLHLTFISLKLRDAVLIAWLYVRSFVFPQVGQSASVVPFIGCFAQLNTSGKSMHAWELILKYYELKNGDRYNSTPARKLSQSFNLDIVGGTAISNKQVRVWECNCGMCYPNCLELWVCWVGFCPVIWGTLPRIN